MATVSGTLRINDAFSNTLNRFNAGVTRASEMTGRLKAAMSGGSSSINSLNKGLGSAHLGMKELIAGSAIGGMISSAMGVAGTGVRAFVGELNESTKAWSTFEGNMHQIGKSPAAIASAKKSLQQFAQDTIYSSSDMAQTYSQLAAVGTKNTTKLVKGFGGLAAAATDPQQAMKTLSEQATQMAAKPMVQWQDFKLMLEQTPAGMAAVGKTMGMNTKQLVKAVQDGKIKTEDFLAAIAKTGTNANFSKMATQYKTVGQALDGLKETIANKVQPQFKKLSDIGIKAISGITDKLGNVNFKPFSDELLNTVNYVKPILDKVKLGIQDVVDGFNSTGAGTEISQMFQQIADSASNLTDTFSGSGIYSTIGTTIGNMAGGLAKFIGTLASVTGKLDPGTLKALGAALLVLKAGTKGLVLTAVVVGLKALNKLNPSQLQSLAKAVTALAIAFAAFKVLKGVKDVFGSLKGLGALGKIFKRTPKTPNLPALSEAPKSGGNAASTFATMGSAMLKLGAAALTAGAGFALLAYGIKTIAQGGSTAIGVLIGVGVAIIVILVAIAALSKPLDVAAVGLFAIGVAALLAGVGILAATFGLSLLAKELPTIAQYGLQAAFNILVLSAAMAVFALGAIIATVGLIALAVGLVVLAVGMGVAAIGGLLFAAALIAVAIGAIIATVGVALLAVGVMILAASSIVAAIGLIMMAVGITLIAAVGIVAALGLMLFAVALMIAAPLMMIAAVGALLLGVAAIILGAGLLVVGAALLVVAGGLIAVGVAVMVLVTMFIMAGTMMVTAITSAMSNVVSSVRNGVSNAVNAARSFAGALVSVGRDLIQGLVNGIKSMVGAAVNAVSSVASRVVGATKNILHIGSPSKLFNQYGRWVDQGLAIGLAHDADLASNASAEMAAGVVAAASDMTPTLNPLSIGKTNVGNLLANGFDRATTAVNSVANALSGLDGTTAGIGINEQDQFDASISSNDANGSNLIGTKFGGSSANNDNRSSTVTIESGAIQINSTGNTDYDADMLLEAIENRLIAQNEKALN
ncbi:tape measure protein [Lactobacillus sp. M0390]|uniref:tape measure protein n=1 Tax=Lactobacillus sp. M0390 TaxID=2751026 RepID=UPI0018DC2F57|nr:tape measure protein [Lactobacillus sp. M0390]